MNKTSTMMKRAGLTQKTADVTKSLLVGRSKSGILSNRQAPRFFTTARRATMEAVDSKKLVPMGDRYIVEIEEAPQAVSQGGVLLSSEAKNDGQVLVGIVKGMPEETVEGVELESRIIFDKYSSQQATLDGCDVWFVRSSNILACLY